MDEEIKTGWVKVQINPERVACIDGGQWHGWLFMRHSEGQLVSCQKLSDWEIMQVEDQRDDGIVLDGGHNVISKSAGARCG